MKRLKRFYILMAIFFGLSAVGFLAIALLGYQKLANLQSQIKESELRSDLVTERESILFGLEKNYDEVEKYNSIITDALPDKKDSSKLLSDLDSLAQTSGLRLTLIQSGINPNQKAGGDLSTSQTKPGKYGLEMPLEVRLDGGYNSLVGFVQNMENYRRLININSIEITKADEKNAASDQIIAKLKITAYLKK